MRLYASHTSRPSIPSPPPKSIPPSSRRSAAPQTTTRSPRSAMISRNSEPKVFERVYAPLAAGLLSPIKADKRLESQRRSQLDRLYQRVIDDLDTLVRAVGLKAA